MFKRALAGLTGLLIAAQAIAGTPEERFDAALKVLKQHCETACGVGLGGDTARAKAADALWDATQDWTLEFLAHHPGISNEKLKTELLNRHPMDIEAARVAPGGVTPLAPNLYAFATNWGEAGDVFLVSKREGRWAVVWDVRKAETGQFPVLKAWRTDHGGESCRDDDGHYGCGSLWGSAFPVKPDAQGRVRFGIGATYAQEGGFTFTKQISFWRWDGSRAEPLMAHTYEQYLEDQFASAPDTPERVVVRVKDEYGSVSSCGSCAGRQLDWTFRILPDQIEDKGKKSLYPEVDAIDAVYARLHDHQSVAGAGTPEALAVMAERRPEGMGDFVAQSDRTGTKVCLSSDSADGPTRADSYASLFLRFHVVRRRGRYFIDRAERLLEGDFNKLCYPKE